MGTSTSSATIVNCIFEGNGAIGGQGGGMNALSDQTVVNSIFKSNYANNGGGTYNWYGNTSIINCVFEGNMAVNKAGGIYSWYSLSQIVNTTIHGNSAGEGGAMTVAPSSDPSLINSILYGNTASISDNEISKHNSSADVNVSCSNVEGGGWTGTGNIDSDPYFENVPIATRWTDAAGTTTSVNLADVTGISSGQIIEVGDDGVARDITGVSGPTVSFSGALDIASVATTRVDIWASSNVDVDLRLKAGSESIDTATCTPAPQTDIDKLGRPEGTNPDMGAYEKDGSSSGLDPLCEGDSVLWATNGHRYRVCSSVRLTWEGAASYCRYFGEYLVIIDDEAENSHVQSLLAESSNAWIGLRAIDVVDDFIWVDGGAISYEKWATDYPVAGGNNGVIMNETTGEWTDAFFKSRYFYICEQDN